MPQHKDPNDLTQFEGEQIPSSVQCVFDEIVFDLMDVRPYTDCELKPKLSDPKELRHLLYLLRKSEPAYQVFLVDGDTLCFRSTRTRPPRPPVDPNEVTF